MIYCPPDSLKRNGRPVNSLFSNEERLFYRAEKAILDDDGKIPPSSIPFPNTSTNREKYSDPDDVIAGMIGFLVYNTKVHQVCLFHQTDGGDGIVNTYNLKPIHDPLDDNYSHTELRVFKNNEIDNATNLTRNVKRHFRGEIRQALTRL